MAVRYTEEQLAAIEAKGKVIVSASAGSGKTAVMIEKIIRLISSGTRVSEILAVTFTKKAAAQMKEKLSRALIKAINAEDATDETRKALKERLAEVPTADISTIHSFCSKLIKTHFYAADADNDFRIISSEDAEGVALKNAALEELFEEGYEEQDEAFCALLSVYWRKKSDNNLKKIFLEGYEKLRNRADYRTYLENCNGYTDETFQAICADLHVLFKDKCRYYRDFIEKEWKYFNEQGGKNQKKLCGELVEWMDELIATPDYFAASRVPTPKLTGNRGGKTSEEATMHVERLGFLKKRFVDAVEREFEKYGTEEEERARLLRSGETARALAVCFLRFDQKYAEKKRERGVLDYNDLEHKALELLTDEEVLCEVRERYKYVFVDEYQDVNPVQEAIVSKIGGKELFLVGDVKQSIYGFRGSKSKFFLEKQEEFSRGDGLSLEMTKNFRSSDAVLDAVNAQFSLAMTKEYFGIDYKNKSYMQRGGLYEPGSGRVQVHFVDTDEDEKKEDRGVYSVRENAKKRKGNASAIARRIRAIIEEERGKEWYDPERKEYVRVRYSDIAILSRKKQGQIAETVAALAAEGVPVTSASSVNVCEYAEVKTLIDILSLIDNAEQDVPLCSALLSSLGKLDVNELAEIRLAYADERLKEGDKTPIPFRAACKRYAAEKTDELAEKLRDFYASFEKYRALSVVLDTGELLTRLIAETRMEAELLRSENGSARLRRVRRFIEATAEPEPTCVHEFLARLRNMDNKVEYNENGGEDAVKALTMHSSKGLEYPVVIVDNLSENFRGVDRDEVYFEEKYGLAPRAFDEENMTKSSTVLRVLHERQEGLSAVADELNLYYVALTRAKYALHTVFASRSAAADVKYAHNCAEFTDFSVWEKYVAGYSSFTGEKEDRGAIAFCPDEQLAKRISEAFLWKYPYAGFEDLPVKSSATRLSEWGKAEEQPRLTFGKIEEYEEDEQAEEVGLSKEVGIAYHAFLENFDFGRLYEADGRADDQTLLVAVDETLLRLERESASLLNRERLLQILQNPVFDGLRGMRLYKERKFLAELPVSETYGKRAGAPSVWKEGREEKVLFQGAIDLLAVGDGEAIVVDYKYSGHGAQELQTAYAAQLDLYRKATAKILKLDENKVRCVLVNIKRGYQVEIP